MGVYGVDHECSYNRRLDARRLEVLRTRKQLLTTDAIMLARVAMAWPMQAHTNQGKMSPRGAVSRLDGRSVAPLARVLYNRGSPAEDEGTLINSW